MLATGRALTLSVREFELLAAMARRAGAIVTRDELYAEVWGGELRSGDRSVDVYVSKLRNKLEPRCPIAASSTPTPASATASSRSPRARPARTGSMDALDISDAAKGPPEGLSRNVHIGAVGDS